MEKNTCDRWGPNGVGSIKFQRSDRLAPHESLGRVVKHTMVQSFMPALSDVQRPRLPEFSSYLVDSCSPGQFDAYALFGLVTFLHVTGAQKQRGIASSSEPRTREIQTLGDRFPGGRISGHGGGTGPLKSRALEEVHEGPAPSGLLIRKSFEIVVALQTVRFFRSAIYFTRLCVMWNMPGNWVPLCTPLFHRNASVRPPISAMPTLRQLDS